MCCQVSLREFLKRTVDKCVSTRLPPNTDTEQGQGREAARRNLGWASGGGLLGRNSTKARPHEFSS